MNSNRLSLYWWTIPFANSTFQELLKKRTSILKKNKPDKESKLSEKYTLSIDEAAIYFGIGQNRLRSIVASNPTADYLMTVGTKTVIKRRMFEKYIDESTAL